MTMPALKSNHEPKSKMSFRQSLDKNLAALLLATLPMVAAEQWTRFDSQPGNKVELNGDGALHSWKFQGAVINGSIEVGPNFPRQPGQLIKPGKAEVRIEVAVPVHSLTNGNRIETRWAQHLLKAEQHPDLVYRLDELILKPSTAGGLFYEAEAHGTLAVAGVTNKISLPLRITTADQRLKISGSGVVKLSDFKIEPPVIRGAKDSKGEVIPDIKLSHDEVNLAFDWSLTQAPTAPANK